MNEHEQWEKETREKIERVKRAAEVLLEKGFGNGRGFEIDDATTEIAIAFGALPCWIARGDRLRACLLEIARTCDGTDGGEAGMRAMRLARRELDHDTKVFADKGRARR